MTEIISYALPVKPRVRRVQVESYFFDIRRQLWEYDQVLNTQRDKVYLERRRALLSADLSARLLEYAERTVDDILEVCTHALLAAIHAPDHASVCYHVPGVALTWAACQRGAPFA